MSLIRRSLRNLIRSPLRTAGIIAILTVSIGLALTMLVVYGASENQIGSVAGKIGTDITVRPAGSFGGFGGMGSEETLVQDDINELSDIDHVVSVQETVQTRYTGDSLQSATESDTTSDSTGPAGEAGSPPRDMGIMVTGVDTETDISDITLMGGGEMTLADGSYFTADDVDADVMVIGQALADANNLSVGSTVDIEDTSVEVIGIYDSGTEFGNNNLIVPVGTVQSLFDLSGATSVTVVADSVDNVDAVVSDIREIFPTSEADITTAEGTYAKINDSLVSASSTTKIGMIAAFAVAGVVILFSVILMVRQRVKEIGILKAIGASNWHIGLQFSVETLIFSTMAAVIGALITFPLAQKVADLLVTDSTVATGPGGFAPPGGGGFLGAGQQVTSIAGLKVAVSPEIFLYALAIAVGLAVLASLFPSWYIARVKPAEVLRYE